MIAAILAKKNLNVLIIDPEPHPKFSIGEATTPDAGCKFKIIGEKYGVPEISYLSNFNDLKTKVSRNCGIKKSFSFLYHEEHKRHAPENSHQFPGPDNGVLGPDCHLFRQDTDGYMFYVALQKGAKSILDSVLDIEFEEERVTAVCKSGKRIECRYIVDAAGYNSVISRKLGLRRTGCLKTNSRTIFSHMINVGRLDNFNSQARHSFHESTLHHVFNGGWFWVIPFDNHEESGNPICSVGLLLNRNIHPKARGTPKEEFYHFVNQFPSVKKQLRLATPVRGWVRSERLQYSSESVTGHRFCLSANSAGFVDPLFSSGLGLTISMTDLIADKILTAFRSNDFDITNFKSIENFFNKSLQHYDEVISRAYESFSDYNLWDSWFRVWVTGNFLGTVSNIDLYFNYLSGRKNLSETQSFRYNNVLGMQTKEQRDFFLNASGAMGELGAGKLTSKSVSQLILDDIKEHELLPKYFRWSDSSIKSTPDFGAHGFVKLYGWARLSNSSRASKKLFTYNPWTSFAKEYIKKKCNFFPTGVSAP